MLGNRTNSWAVIGFRFAIILAAAYMNIWGCFSQLISKHAEGYKNIQWINICWVILSSWIHIFCNLTIFIGTKPRISRRTMYFITPRRQHDMEEACAVITKIENHDNGSKITMSVNMPCDSVIGYFKFHVVMKKRDDAKFTKYRYNDDIIVLFNPWVKGERTYLNAGLIRHNKSWLCRVYICIE